MSQTADISKFRLESSSQISATGKTAWARSRFRGALRGFSLVELMIAIVILAEIATFTIPKLIASQQNQRYNSAAKEMMGTVSGAYTAYIQANGQTTAVSYYSLIPYINYVKKMTSGTIDDVQTQGTLTCTNATPCIVLHNGGCMLMSTDTFYGATSNHFIASPFDPDCNSSGTYKALDIWLYYNGRISTYTNATIGSIDAWGGVWTTPAPQYDPPWFRL